MLLGLAAVMAAPEPEACRAGQQAASRGDFAVAAKLLQACLQSPKAPLEAMLTLCGVYQAQRDGAKLYAAALEGTRRFPDDKRFYLTAGTYAGRNRQFADGVRILEEGSRRWPDDAKIRALLASSLFGRGTELLDAGENAEAASYLKHATELAPDDVEAQMNLGRALHNLARYSDAAEAFDAAIRLQPGFPLARFHRGLTRYSLGEFEPAMEDLNAQIAQDSSYAPTYLVRGLTRMAQGTWSAALPDLEIAAGRLPDSASAQYSLARVLVQLERYTDAEPKLRRAMELDPADPAPVHSLVTVLLRTDRRDEARELARKAAKLARAKRSVEPGEIRYGSPGRSAQ